MMSIPLIAEMVLFFCYFAIVHGGSPKAGNVIITTCMGPSCMTDCHKRKQAVHFGLCSPKSSHPGMYELYNCYEGLIANHAVVEHYDNDKCEGKPTQGWDSNNCYHRGRWAEDVHWHDAFDWPSYTFQCLVAKHHLSTEVGKETNDNVDVNIVMVVSLIVFVGVIGFIAGYLLYRKRKKQ